MTSAFAEIIRAITPFGIPHAPGKYEGEETEKWFTYNYADDRGNAFADDEPGDRLVSMQLHLYLPERENFISIRRDTPTTAGTLSLTMSQGTGSYPCSSTFSCRRGRILFQSGGKSGRLSSLRGNSLSRRSRI